MDAPTTGQLLTVAGNSAVTYLLLEVIWRAVNPDPATKDRFGPLSAVLVGVVLAVAAWAVTYGLGAPYTSLLDAVLVGLVGGAASMGIHDLTG